MILIEKKQVRVGLFKINGLTESIKTQNICNQDGITRDANFQDAEIVRSEKRRGLRPRERPSGVQEQRHFGGPGELCHCI